jgi:methionyl-tRNA formyltransferase
MNPPRRRLVFAGSPDFAVPALEVLAHSGHEVVAVLTQPDRPAGRGLGTRASPVKVAAVALGLTVWQPGSLRRDPVAVARLAELAPDLMVVVAFGQILPPEVLAIPRRGCVNLHASLLPRWRGAAPIQAAILAGDAETGVTLMQLDAGLDTGPMLASVRVPIDADTTGGSLHDELAQRGAGLLRQHLDALLAGTLSAAAQPETGVSWAPKLAKSDARLDWREPAEQLGRRVRAYQPWPIAETTLDGRQLRIHAAQVLPAAGMAPAALTHPGTVLDAAASGIDVQAGAGVLRLTSVQLAGRQRLAAAEFARGQALAGKVLGA